MSQPNTANTTIACIPLPPDTHIDLDPLDGGTHVFLAVTGPGGVRVEGGGDDEWETRRRDS